MADLKYIALAFVLFNIALLPLYIEYKTWDYMLTPTGKTTTRVPDLYIDSTRENAIDSIALINGNQGHISRSTWNDHPHTNSYIIEFDTEITLCNLTSSAFTVLAEPKDRTRMRLDVAFFLQERLGIEDSGYRCNHVWATFSDDVVGLVHLCSYSFFSDFYAVGKHKLPNIDLVGHINTFDDDAFVNSFILYEILKDLNRMCQGSVVKVINGTASPGGVLDQDNGQGARIDHQVLTRPDGFVAGIQRKKRCKTWFKDAESHAVQIQKRYTEFRKSTTDADIDAFISDWLAQYGDMARETFDLWTSGGTYVRFSIFFNTPFVAPNFYRDIGGDGMRAPASYNASVDFYRTYLFDRLHWMDSHMHLVGHKPYRKILSVPFVVSIVVNSMIFISFLIGVSKAALTHRPKPKL